MNDQSLLHMFYLTHILKMDADVCDVYELHNTELKLLGTMLLQFDVSSIQQSQIISLDKCL